jgi:hypothetical protein
LHHLVEKERIKEHIEQEKGRDTRRKEDDEHHFGPKLVITVFLELRCTNGWIAQDLGKLVVPVLLLSKELELLFLFALFLDLLYSFVDVSLKHFLITLKHFPIIFSSRLLLLVSQTNLSDNIADPH